MKRAKNFLSLAVASMLTLGVLSGCSPKEVAPTPSADPVTATEEGSPEVPTESTGSNEKFNVYLVTMDQMDQHWVNVDRGCKQAVEELQNVNYTWMAPDVKDDNKQIESVNNAVAGGADAILIAANGPDAIVATLEEAQAAGVRIVYIDSPANLPAVQTLATDNKAAGETAGKEMRTALESKGVMEGSIGILNTNAASISTLDREAGFRSVFEGTGFTILETQYTEGDAARSKDAAANFITQGCVGIFGANEGTTVGTGNAIKESGTEVVGVGFDKSDMILNLVEDGSLLCVMAQNPDQMGYRGMYTAVEALQGRDATEAYIDTGVTVINKDNVSTLR